MPAKMTRLTCREPLTVAEGAERLRRLVADLAEMWDVDEAEVVRYLSRALDTPVVATLNRTGP